MDNTGNRAHWPFVDWRILLSLVGLTVLVGLGIFLFAECDSLGGYMMSC